MSADTPNENSGRRRGPLFSGMALVVVAALVAGTVVVVRQPQAAPAAESEPLQVGVEAPTVAIEGDTIPVAVAATGPDPLRLVELWVGASLVDAVELDGSDTSAALTLHWSALGPGVVSIRARASDTSGRTGFSNTTTVLVGSRPLVHVVENPEGATLVEIAEEAGVDPDAAAAGNPGLDPNERLIQGSVLFLPPLPQEGSSPAPAAGTASIDGAVLRIGEPVDGLFLYLTFAGQVLRVPADPAELIPGDQPEIDLSPFLPPLPSGDVSVEVWGRSGGDVSLLAELVVASSSLLAPATDLVALLELAPFNITVPVTSLKATNAETIELEWSSNVPHEAVRWFLSTGKPNPVLALTPTAIVQDGLATPQEEGNLFSIDLGANTPPTLEPGRIFSAPLTAAPDEGTDAGDTDADAPAPRRGGHLGPTWAWVVPVDAAGHPVGPASEPVRIIITEAPFDPSEAPPFDVLGIDVVIPPAPNPVLTDCVRIVSQTPPFPTGIGFGFYLNPDGSTTPRASGGTKITGTLPYTLDAVGRAVYPFTACPGERGTFQWGSVGCGADPFCHISKGLTDLGKAAEAFGKFLVDLANEVADAYNELKAWAIAQVAAAICPDEVAGPCETLIEIAVDALLTAVGVPPTMPNFDDLADLAKGELVDLAMDQLGVGSVCDAVAQAGTGKSCGELATELQNLDACSFAPKGREDDCRDLVEQATSVCQFATQRTECEALTTNAQDLIEAGVEGAVEESVEAIKTQVTRASMESLGFPGHGMSSQPFDHACRWGGPDRDQVICPPLQTTQVPSPLPGGPTFEVYEPPPGCAMGTFGSDDGKVVCSFPRGEIVAIPEPRGQRQPIQVDVLLSRNDNPLPDDFECGPIYAAATTITPRGAIGQPYLPSATAFPSESLFLLDDLYRLTLWLNEPNPHVEIPDDMKPPPPTGMMGEIIGAAVGEAIAGSTFASSEWRYLLEEGSYVAVTIWGECIPKTGLDGPYGIAGVIPPPLPRMTPGVP